MGENIFIVKKDTWLAFEGRVTGQGDWRDLSRFGGAREIWFPHADLGCRCYLRDGIQEFMLMYLEPKLRPFFYAGTTGRGVRSYSVILPHAYIGILFEKGRLVEGCGVISAKPIGEDLDAPMGTMPLPNINSYGGICIGHGSYFNDMPPSVAAQKYVQRFLTASFNIEMGLVPAQADIPAELAPDDSDVHGRQRRDGNDAYFKKWQKYSREHGVRGTLKLDWSDDEFSINDWLDTHDFNWDDPVGVPYNTEDLAYALLNMRKKSD